MPAPSRRGPRRRAAAAVLAAAAATGLAACSNTTGGAGNTGYVEVAVGISTISPADRQPAPALAGTTLDGAKLALADYKGDVVVINVWGSWCGPCRKEAPALAETAVKYQGRGVRFLGINARDEDAAALAMVASTGTGYPSLRDPDERLLLEFKSVLPATGIPSSVIIDRAGRVAVRILGAVTEPQLTQRLDAVLGEH